jgi:ABC-2 type transport system permease protein
VPIAGSIPLFLVGAALDLFAMTAIGIFMATIARSMPQFAMLTMLVLFPLQMLSGAQTPRESMPLLAQRLMEVAPSTHFVQIAQAILYRSAGIDVVWPQLVTLAGIGGVFFAIALIRFRKTISLMGA